MAYLRFVTSFSKKKAVAYISHKISASKQAHVMSKPYFHKKKRRKKSQYLLSSAEAVLHSLLSFAIIHYGIEAKIVDNLLWSFSSLLISLIHQ